MLTGKSVLIVEEEFLIALDIQRVLESLNARDTMFARSAQEAIGMSTQWDGVGLAVVEIHNTDASSLELSRRLEAARIPLVLTTSDIALRRGIPGLDATPIVLKPVPEDALTSAIRQALAR